MQFLEILTVGFPFCAFKIVSGLYFQQQWLTILGLVDFFINLSNLIALAFLGRRVFDACLFSTVVRVIKKPGQETIERWQDFGNSLDVVFSFILVAYVIGSGAIGTFPDSFRTVWNVSVILNVLGAGSSRLAASIEKLNTKS